MFGPVEIIVLGLLGAVALPAWLAVRSIRRHGADRWRRIGRRRWGWVLVVLLVPAVGPALYVRLVRPELLQSVERFGANAA